MQREEHSTRETGIRMVIHDLFDSISANFEKTVLKFVNNELLRILVDCFVISLVTKVAARRTCLFR